MDLSNFKIAHTSDLHLLVQGQHLNRHQEWKTNINTFVKSILDGGFDALFIVGDIFHRFRASELERLLFANILHQLDEAGIITIITLGNHDLDQDYFAYDGGTGELETIPDAVGVTIKSVDGENICFLNKTKFYQGVEVHKKLPEQIQIGVWNHGAKYSTIEEEYNPHVEKIGFVDGKFNIELFHDPVQDCLNWNGKVVKGDNDHRIRFDQFHGHMNLFGDIHLPQIFNPIGAASGQLTGLGCYPSSPFPTNYGEGDYYMNATLTQESNNKHGYRSYNVDLVNKQVLSTEWVPFKAHSEYFTFDLDNGITLDEIERFEFPNRPEHAKIKIRLHSYGEQFDLKVQALTSRLNKLYLVSEMDIEYMKNTKIVSENEVNQILQDDSPTNLTLDSVLKMVDEYAKDNITLKKVGDEETVKKVTELFKKILTEKLSGLDWSTSVNKVKFVGTHIKNMLSIEDIRFGFGDNKLTSLVAANGSGKSNIAKSINFGNFGRIDATQSANQLKTTAIEFIHDKSPIDTASVCNTYDMDGETINLTRTIKRKWKSKKSFASDPKNWKKNVSGVDVTFKITNGEGEDITHREVEIMQKMFGSFEEFNELHFITQDVLEDLILMQPTHLMNFFLKHFSLDVFNQISDGYNEIKAKHLDVLAKPEKNSIALREDLDKVKEERETLKKSAIENTRVGDVLTEKLSIQNQLKEAELKAMPQINQELIDKFTNNTLDELQATNQQLTLKAKGEVEQLSKDRAEVVTKRTEIEDKLNAFQKSLEEHSNAIIQKTKYVNEKNVEINTHNATITELQGVSANNKQNKIEEFGKVQAGIQKKITEKNTEYSNTATQIINDANKNIQDTINGKQTQLNELSGVVASLKTESSMMLHEVTKKQAEINNHVDTCPTCKRTYDNIEQLNQHKVTLQRELSALVQNQKTKETEHSNKSQELVNLNSEIQNLKGTLHDISKANQNPLVTGDARITQILSDIQKMKVLMETSVNEMNTFKNDPNVILNESEVLRWNEACNQINEINGTIQSINGEIQVLNNKKVECENNINTNKSQLVVVGSLENIDEKITQKHEEYNGYIQANAQLIADHTLYDGELKKVETKKEIDKRLLVINKEINEINEKITVNDQEGHRLISESGRLSQVEEGIKKDINDAMQYTVMETALKYVKNSIGKSGIQRKVFNRILSVINYQIDQEMKGLNYRVIFDTVSGKLLMLDMLGSVQSTRPCFLMSGMQKTLAGLAIIKVIKSLKTTRNMNELFIDEISGKLNDGKQTKGSSTTNKNYQKILGDMLKRFVECGLSILIVDHVLDPALFDKQMHLSISDEGFSNIVV